jgi:hypothetical protein
LEGGNYFKTRFIRHIFRKNNNKLKKTYWVPDPGRVNFIGDIKRGDQVGVTLSWVL